MKSSVATRNSKIKQTCLKIFFKLGHLFEKCLSIFSLNLDTWLRGNLQINDYYKVKIEGLGRRNLYIYIFPEENQKIIAQSLYIPRFKVRFPVYYYFRDFFFPLTFYSLVLHEFTFHFNLRVYSRVCFISGYCKRDLDNRIVALRNLKHLADLCEWVKGSIFHCVFPVTIIAWKHKGGREVPWFTILLALFELKRLNARLRIVFVPYASSFVTLM